MLLAGAKPRVRTQPHPTTSMGDLALRHGERMGAYMIWMRWTSSPNDDGATLPNLLIQNLGKVL
jgi:hypothetical protein